MRPIGYVNRLKKDIARWLDLGLLAEAQGEAILQDVNASHRSRSFGSVVAILGAVLIAAALVAFVAANWNQMPKLARVAMLISSIWGSYLAAYIATLRQSPVIAEAFLVIGIAAFGASIMLIGQIYQLQGRNEDALFVWMLGGVATTVLARSPWSLVFTVGVGAAWMIAEFNSGRFGTDAGELPFWLAGIEPFHLFPLAWLGFAGIAVWLRSQASGHVLMLTILVWSMLFVSIWNAGFLPRAILITAIALVALALVLRDITNQRRLGGFGVSTISYLIVFLFVFVLYDLSEIGKYYRQLPLPGVLVSQFSSIGFFSWVNSLLPLAVASAAGFSIAFWMRRRGETLLRDQWVIAIAGLVLLVIKLPVVQMLGPIFIVYTIVAIALSIWTIRFGWRLESRFVSAIGYLGFAATVLISYQRLFGTLINTAAFYAIAGAILLLTAVVLLRLERRSSGKGAS